jgi:hypothetical protein
MPSRDARPGRLFGLCPNRPNLHTDFRIIEPYTPTAVHGSPKHTKGRKRRKRSGQELCLSLRNPDPDLIHSELLVFVIPVARKTESLAVETETLWRTQLLGGAIEHNHHQRSNYLLPERLGGHWSPYAVRQHTHAREYMTLALSSYAVVAYLHDATW